MRFSIAFVVDSCRSSFFGRRSRFTESVSSRPSSRDDAAPGWLSRRRRAKFVSIVRARSPSLAAYASRSACRTDGFMSSGSWSTTLGVLCAWQPRQRTSDGLFRVRDRTGEAAVHVEIEREWRAKIPSRLFDYASSAATGTRLPV